METLDLDGTIGSVRAEVENVGQPDQVSVSLDGAERRSVGTERALPPHMTLRDQGSPSADRPTMLAFPLRPLLATAGEHGADVGAILARWGVDPAIVENPLARIETRILPGLAADLEEACPDVPLALLAASRLRMGQLGLLDTLLWAIPTLRDGVEINKRCFRLIHDELGFELVEEGKTARLQLVKSGDRVLVPLLAEYLFAIVAHNMAALMGRDRPSNEVRFIHTRRLSARALRDYEEFFRARVIFGTERYEMLGPSVYLDLPLPRPRPEVREALQREVEEALLRHRPVLPFVERVKQVVWSAIEEGGGSLRDVASRMGTSARTLQRRLREEGTSFEAIVGEVRRQSALSYAAHGADSIMSVAKKAGFSSPSAFARAFKRWTAMSPSEYRAQTPR